MAKRRKHASHHIGRVTVRWDPRAGRRAWYFRWTDKAGKQRSRRGSAELVMALEAARALDREVENERLGIQVADPMRVSLADLARDYLAWMGKGRRASRKHVAEVASILHRAFDGLGARLVSQVRRRDVERYLDGLATEVTEDTEKGKALPLASVTSVARGLAGRTLNKHLTCIKGLFAWAVREERLASSPLAGLARRPDYEKRRRRQALSPAQIERVLRLARGGQPWERVAYSLGFGAGLRAGEIRGLRWGDVDLKAGTYTLRAERQKGHKETVTPLRAELVKLLRAWRKEQLLVPPGGWAVRPDMPVVRGFPSDPSPAWKRTLAAAGIPYRNALGEVCDMHAMRHSFETNLGADPSIRIEVKQLLMRHADIKTTRGYDHSGLEEQAAALRKVPSISGKKKVKRRRKAEG